MCLLPGVLPIHAQAAKHDAVPEANPTTLCWSQAEHCTLQVVVTESDGRTSTSEQRRVALATKATRARRCGPPEQVTTGTTRPRFRVLRAAGVVGLEGLPPLTSLHPADSQRRASTKCRSLYGKTPGSGGAGGTGAAGQRRLCALHPGGRHGPLWHQVRNLGTLALRLPEMVQKPHNSISEWRAARQGRAGDGAVCLTLSISLVTRGTAHNCPTTPKCPISRTIPLPRCTYALWATHLLGLLLLPKLLGRRNSSSKGPASQQPPDAVASALRWAATPLTNLQDMATMGTPWLLQVGLLTFTPFCARLCLSQERLEWGSSTKHGMCQRRHSLRPRRQCACLPKAHWKHLSELLAGRPGFQQPVRPHALYSNSTFRDIVDARKVPTGLGAAQCRHQRRSCPRTL